MTAEECLKEGYKYFCMGCFTPYKVQPTVEMDGGGNCYDYPMCRCGSDLFMEFEEYIKNQKENKHEN